MLTKEQKKEIIGDITDKIERQKSLVITDFRGLKVGELEELRNQLREIGVDFKAVKKTLIKIASEKAKKEIDTSQFDSSTALAFSYEDEIAPIKVIYKFAKNHENLKILGGMMDGKLLTIEEVEELAKLLSRDELLAKLVGSIKAPINGLANVLQGNTRDFVGLLSAIVSK